MDWIKKFDLILLDFDGLLVDTESLHYKAYQLLCERHGCNLDWSFEEYCAIAHSQAGALKPALYTKFPKLYEEQPDWSVLYSQKKEIYLQVLKEETLALMPGVREFLLALEASGIRRVVATHSPKEQIDEIRKRLPELEAIPHFITREDYENPKPAPDAYLKAIATIGKDGDRIIGFEDSLRGLRALQGTKAVPVLIANSYPAGLEPGSLHFPSFQAVSI